MTLKTLKTVGIKTAFAFIGFALFSKILRIVLFPQVRAGLMRMFGAKIGENTIVFDVTFASLHNYGLKRLSIGINCFLGDDVLLDCRGGIEIEDEVIISNRCSLITHQDVGRESHPLKKFFLLQEKAVVVRRGSYLGTGAIIMPGITIGPESVVAAGAVVTHDVPPRCVVAGVPARIIRKLDE